MVCSVSYTVNCNVHYLVIYGESDNNKLYVLNSYANHKYRVQWIGDGMAAERGDWRI